MAKKFLHKYLGENFESDIIKSDVGAILKPEANASVLPQEMYISLQIVPRTIISMLVQHLKPLKPGGIADIPWHTDEGNVHNIHINKISSDLYSGNISGEGKILSKFSYRSLPAVGLVIMSTYELYDRETNSQDLKNPDIDYDKIQKIIDERIRMQLLVKKVSSKNLSKKDAIQQLIVQKINDYLRSSESIKKTILDPDDKEIEASEHVEEMKEEIHTEDAEDIDIDKEVMEEIKESNKQDKKNKLKEFLDKTVKKTDKIYFSKSQISCPYCATKIYKGEDSIELCVCFGEEWGSEIKIKKNKDNEYSFKYPKNFSMDNANMLLGFLKKKN